MLGPNPTLRAPPGPCVHQIGWTELVSTERAAAARRRSRRVRVRLPAGPRRLRSAHRRGGWQPATPTGTAVYAGYDAALVDKERRLVTSGGSTRCLVQRVRRTARPTDRELHGLGQTRGRAQPDTSLRRGPHSAVHGPGRPYGTWFGGGRVASWSSGAGSTASPCASRRPMRTCAVHQPSCPTCMPLTSADVPLSAASCTDRGRDHRHGVANSSPGTARWHVRCVRKARTARWQREGEIDGDDERPERSARRLAAEPARRPVPAATGSGAAAPCGLARESGVPRAGHSGSRAVQTA